MFDEILERIKYVTGAKNDNQLSEKLKLSSNSVIVGWRKRGKVPDKRVQQVTHDYGINETWLLSGEGEIYNEVEDEIPHLNILKRLTQHAQYYGVSLNYSLLDPCLNRLQNILYMRIILKKIEGVLKNEEINDILPFKEEFLNITSSITNSRNRELQIIEYILNTIQKSDYQYFTRIEAFPLIFDLNEESILPLVETFGHTSDDVEKRIIEKNIKNFIADYFSFDNLDLLLFLKDNITFIQQLFKEWLVEEEIESSKYDILYATVCTPSSEENIAILNSIDISKDPDAPYYFDDPRNYDSFYDMEDERFKKA